MAPINTSLSKQLSTASNRRYSHSSHSGSNSLNLQPRDDDDDDVEAGDVAGDDDGERASQEFQNEHIGELPRHSAATPISPAALRSSNAWQHASVLLRKQQLQSRIKSSEERDQEAAQAAQIAGALGGAARVGTTSCWGSVQSIFMLPKGLAEIKAKHPTEPQSPHSNNNKPVATMKNLDQQLASPKSAAAAATAAEKRTSLSGGL